ncbi:MAG: hypothetical protein H8D23_38850 [Candidatus Brocadiales bacterium]|nr:hypothetical protein [Candidatus Brocadiales bacterium]
MEEHKLQFRQKISRRSAHEMILLFAKHGNHYHQTHFRSDADVKRAFQRNGVDYNQLQDKCRDVKNSVPFFENLVGSTWEISSGATASRVLETGEKDIEVKGPGQLTLLGYWATFEAAKKALDDSVNNISYADFQMAVVQGIASIEGYINHQAEIWNRKNPNDQLSDSKQDIVRFDDKIDLWIPKMTNGKKLDKSGVNWRDFRNLRSIRDNLAIHPKMSGHGTSYSDLANEINSFRTGIAGLLIQLHILFKDRIPRIVIRSAHSPDVEVIKVMKST